jgi:hypothetical protein
MREIKFRGKCVPDSNYAGEWVIGGYIHPTVDSDQKEGLIVRYLGGTVTRTFHVLPSTVGQYTGLNDKEGREIYEGDIVRGYFKGRYGQQTLVSVIGWDKENACFEIRLQEEPNGLLSEPDEMEVIGNIHDNPELLEQREPSSSLERSSRDKSQQS